jgi:hypothetical protein
MKILRSKLLAAATAGLCFISNSAFAQEDSRPLSAEPEQLPAGGAAGDRAAAVADGTLAAVGGIAAAAAIIAVLASGGGGKGSTTTTGTR